MSLWILALVLGIGTTAWLYNYLARSSGNPNPRSNLILASIVGFVVFLIILTFTNMVLG